MVHGPLKNKLQRKTDAGRERQLKYRTNHVHILPRTDSCEIVTTLQRSDAMCLEAGIPARVEVATGVTSQSVLLLHLEHILASVR